MKTFTKPLFYLAAAFFVYSLFFFTHVQKQHTQQVLGARANLSLFTQPETGDNIFISQMNMAQKSIDMEMYLLSDKAVIADLLANCQRGIVVRVLLEQHPYGGSNNKTKQQLDSTCVKTEWTNSQFSLTHEKTIVIDSTKSFILNQNLTAAAFTKNREFNIIDTNPEDTKELEDIFQSDWDRRSYAPPVSHLVVSPDNSRDVLSQLLSPSVKEIDGEMEVIDDPDIIHLLESKAQTVAIHLVFPSLQSVPANKPVLEDLQNHGIVIKTLAKPYIHAKMLLVDLQKAYVGSINLTTQSMDENREVGIIISQPDILVSLQSNFQKDWDSASSL